MRSLILNYLSASNSDIFFDFFMFQDDKHKRNFSLDDDDLEARLNSWNLGVKWTEYFTYLLTCNGSSSVMCSELCQQNF